ncbi:MAG TPA: exo-beta-N-acetylmuramidase NamZ domain-containing protein [Opitutus sp.]|nr:exo-beta-N-acetylmuramidase NamZ domain-containing protein [Opitutus sp.]
MPGLFRSFSVENLFTSLALAFGLLGCSASQPPSRPLTPATPVAATPTPPAPRYFTPRIAQPSTSLVLLGVDVLEAQGFAPIKGKRVGLLTHAAGVNRNGVSSVEVLRRAPNVKLVALFSPEHGLYSLEKASVNVASGTDPRTGLPVYSLHGAATKPTKAMLKGLDALVVDLQDIGTRSYTYVATMKLAMEACFENNVEFVVLDRPNPLGGLKADGPPLDAKWVSWNVGSFRVPYVHGLTIAELARMAKEAPGVLGVPDNVRARGRLTIVPMRGWRRSMRWPETGLNWVPTSPMIQDFAAVLGYPMVGLGAFANPPKIDTGFRHGIGTAYPFRGISHKTVKIDILERELLALNLPGIQFRRVSAPDRDGKPAVGLYVEITDYDEWRPTELNFWLMKLACKLSPQNPFLPGPGRDFSGFLRHMGSEQFLQALQRDGARVDVAAFIADWERRAAIYRAATKRYWLYQ